MADNSSASAAHYSYIFCRNASVAIFLPDFDNKSDNLIIQ